jgi:hypothetical protein
VDVAAHIARIEWGTELRAFLAVIAGIVGLAVGYGAAAFLSYVIMGWAGVSDFEGERAMTSAFAWGPLGGVIGLGLGIWLALRLTRPPR